MQCIDSSIYKYTYVYSLRYGNVYIYSASVDVQKLTSKNMAMVTHMPDLIQGSVSSFVPGG